MQPRIPGAGLLDGSGRPIDGEHDGQPGGDRVATFANKRVAILRKR
jgi:hypothetical protein